MHILQRIRFAPSPSAQPLYAQDHAGQSAPHTGLPLAPRTTLDLDSFFNSLVLGPNGWPADVGRIICRLHVQGDVKACLVQRDPAGNESEIGTFREAEPGVIQSSFDASGATPCRVFARMIADDGGTLLGGHFACDARMEPICPAVVFCTYQRETDILRNVRTLCDDADLMASGLRVYVADNGRTVEPETLPQGVVLLPGPNRGGAGGFNRGIREAVRQGATHVILMDDDVTLDSEAVFRCCACYRLGPRNQAIAGVLLDEKTPATVQEAGAWVSDTRSPFVVRVCNSGQRLADPKGLDALYATPEPEYGGFWLFAFPVETLRAAGLIAPIFFKADDIEFCLRLRKHDAKLRLLPGVGVQHPGFTTDFSMVKRYYWIRNMLVVEALHGERTGLRVALAAAREVMKEWRKGRPHFAAPLLLGMEDFLNGPGGLQVFDNARRISSLNALSGTLQEESDGWFGRTRHGGRYALRGLLATARLAVRYARLKESWCRWLPGAVE